MNNTTISGRIVKDALTRTVNIGGTPTLVTDFTVAADSGRYVRDEAGVHAANTEYFRVSLWRDQGAKLAQYLKKGREVTVEGAVYAQAWTATQGENAGKPMAQLCIRNARVTLHGAKPVEDAPEEEMPFTPDPEEA